MNIDHFISDVASGALVGAVAGSITGPLGAAGGALMGGFTTLSCTVFKSYKEDWLETESDPDEIAKIENIARLVQGFLFIGSAYAAAAMVGVSITFTAVLYTGLIALPFAVIISYVNDIFKREVLDNWDTLIENLSDCIYES